MQLTVRKKSLQWSGTLAEYAHERVEQGLRRIRDRVRTVAIKFAPISNPHGRDDRHCHVTVRLANGQEVRVNALDSCPYRAVDDVARRLKYAVRRAADKTRMSRRRARR